MTPKIISISLLLATVSLTPGCGTGKIKIQGTRVDSVAGENKKSSNAASSDAQQAPAENQMIPNTTQAAAGPVPQPLETGYGFVIDTPATYFQAGEKSPKMPLGLGFLDLFGFGAKMDLSCEGGMGSSSNYLLTASIAIPQTIKIPVLSEIPTSFNVKSIISKPVPEVIGGVSLTGDPASLFRFLPVIELMKKFLGTALSPEKMLGFLKGDFIPKIKILKYNCQESGSVSMIEKEGKKHIITAIAFNTEKKFSHVGFGIAGQLKDTPKLVDFKFDIKSATEPTISETTDENPESNDDTNSETI